MVTPSGETVYVPLRAIADGDDCEVVFTLRRAPGMTDDELERDAALVTADLALLKQRAGGALSPRSTAAIALTSMERARYAEAGDHARP